MGLPVDQRLAPGTPAELTVFDVVEADLPITDAMGAETRLRQLIEPRWTIVGCRAIRATRHAPGQGASSPARGGAH